MVGAFAKDASYIGDGVGSYLAPETAPSQLDNYKRDSAFVYLGINVDGGNVATAIGQDGANAIRLAMNPRSGTGAISGRLNSSTSFTTAATVASRVGRTAFSRVNASQVNVYRDGALIETVASASAVPSSQTDLITVLRNNVSYLDDGVNVIALGGGLSDREVADFDAAIKAYVKATAPPWRTLTDFLKLNDRVYSLESPQKPHSIQQSWTHNNLFRFEVRDGEQVSGDIDRSSVFNRAEIYPSGHITADEEVWYSFAIRAFGVSAPNTARVVFQTIGTISGTHAPLLQILCQHDSFRIRTYEDVGGVITNVTRHVGAAMTEGGAESIVIRCKFSESEAELQVWRNGAELINLSGISMGDDVSSTPKFGIYRDGAADTFITEVANWQIGADLSGQISSPLAPPASWA